MVVYKPRGARVNSVLHVQDKATCMVNDPGIPPLTQYSRHNKYIFYSNTRIQENNGKGNKVQAVQMYV